MLLVKKSNNSYDETKSKTIIEYLLYNSLKVIRMYDWIIDAYVLDFYIDNHWNKLPKSWQNEFSNIDPMHFSEFLQHNNNFQKNQSQHDLIKRANVWPLSLLALRKLIQFLSIPRNRTDDKDDGQDDKETVTTLTANHSTSQQFTIQKNVNDNNDNNFCPLTHPKLQNLFKKCVKPKKLHEIEKLSKLCNSVAKELNIKYIVDFGSGLGHLARKLSYGYNLNVCCIEMNSNLNEQARKLDEKFETIATKYLKENYLKNVKRPIHLNLKLTKQMTSNEFIKILKSAFNINNNNNNDSTSIKGTHLDDKLSDFQFGIIGLHPCGDLSAVLIDLFLKCNEAKFINLVGCCYMKLTTNTTPQALTNDLIFNLLNETTNNINQNNHCDNNNSNKQLLCGYPLSRFLKKFKEKHSENFFYNLSYESREIACHAMEIYKNRLEKGNYEDLKVHSYRAALEMIIVKYWPQYKHSGLRNVKHTNSLSFKSYCEKALNGLEIHVSNEDILSDETQNRLEQWKNIVIFYTLRLIFAPLIESIIIYDRMLHLIENDFDVDVKAIFDPLLSPRNHLIIAKKCS